MPYSARDIWLIRQYCRRMGSLEGLRQKRLWLTAHHPSSAYPGLSLRQGLIGVQVSMPLSTGGLIDSRVREALATLERARQDLEASRRNAAQSARTSYLNVSNGIAQVKALEQAVVSANVALDSSKLGMEVGVRTNVDVLNALQQRLNLNPGDLRYSAQMLREYGNMSSAFVYFVLDAALRDDAAPGWWWMSSFGAGFSCHGALLKAA